METNNLDSKARYAAKRNGWRVSKCRKPFGLDNHGGFMLADENNYILCNSARYDMSAEEVIEYCARYKQEAEEEENEWRTALHEAGHAVATIRLFGREHLIDKITIVPNDTTGNAGSFKSENLSSSWQGDPTVSVVEHEATIFCAGYAALIAAGFSESESIAGAEDDFKQAQVKSTEPLGVIKQRAVELMQREENQKAVRIIADKLDRCKTLGGEDVGYLMLLADGEWSIAEYQRAATWQEWPAYEIPSIAGQPI